MESDIVVQRRYLKTVKEWRVLIDSICWADLDKLSDEQVEAYVDQLNKLGGELEALLLAVEDAS